MSLLKSAALALVLATSSVAVVAQDFVPIKSTTTFSIGVNLKTLVIEMSPSGFPVAFMDVNIILVAPGKTPSGASIKSYVNTLAIDCFNEHTILVVGRAFSESGELVGLTNGPALIPKPYSVDSAAAIMVDATCPAIFDAIKPKEVPRSKWLTI